MNIELPNKEQSYWLQKVSQTYSKLTEDIVVDVAIAGGGIAGLTIAYTLKKSGLKVAVVEKNTIASGTTGGTTGKVSMQHGLIYAQLLQQFGIEKAKIYADSYTQAFSEIKQLIKRENIDCDWQSEDNFVYTTDATKVLKFQKEAGIAAQLGLPATFETQLSLPFETKGAVKFNDQARFNATKYTQALAAIVNSAGSYVFEHSNVTNFHEGNQSKITTSKGSVQAKHVVVATKVPAAPLLARLTYAAIEYPETSYVVAARTKTPIKGMYISPDNGHYSIQPAAQNGKNYILIGGENHIPGLGNPEKRHQKLADYAGKWFNADEIAYRWKAMDYMAYDKLPVIGKLYPWSRTTYAATGFKKWGLSTSMIAANVIKDLINGEETAQTKLFYPHRASAPLHAPKAMFDFLKG